MNYRNNSQKMAVCLVGWIPVGRASPTLSDVLRQARRQHVHMHDVLY